MDKLNEKELRVLNQVAQNSVISQRELARETGISLGLINVILKKFLHTGYLQVSQLNKRKLEYVLTPNGFLAVARKTYNFASSVIRNYRQIHTSLSELLISLHESGYDYFSISGDGELRELIEIIVPVVLRGTNAELGHEHRDSDKAVILNVAAESVAGSYNGRVINVLEMIK